MTSPIRVLVATFLLGACAFLQAASPRPAGTVTWTVSTFAIGPASLVGHGTATPATQVVNDGDPATITITPDPGYELISIDDGGISDVTPNGDGTWTTDPVVSDFPIYVTFALSPSDVVLQADFDPDIKTFDDANVVLQASLLGTDINWQTGATCSGTPNAPCGENYHLRACLGYGANPVLVFRFPTGDEYVVDDSLRSYGTVGYTTDGEDYSQALQSGATIGSDQTFVFPVQPFGTAAWVTANGVDAYLGFRFLNSNSGRINYGYAHLVTSGAIPPNPLPTGFPATIVGYSYNQRGDAITIP